MGGKKNSNVYWGDHHHMQVNMRAIRDGTFTVGSAATAHKSGSLSSPWRSRFAWRLSRVSESLVKPLKANGRDTSSKFIKKVQPKEWIGWQMTVLSRAVLFSSIGNFKGLEDRKSMIKSLTSIINPISKTIQVIHKIITNLCCIETKTYLERKSDTSMSSWRLPNGVPPHLQNVCLMSLEGLQDQASGYNGLKSSLSWCMMRHLSSSSLHFL